MVHITRKIFHSVYPFRTSPRKGSLLSTSCSRTQHLCSFGFFTRPILSLSSNPALSFPFFQHLPSWWQFFKQGEARLRLFLSFHTCSTGISGPGGRICKLNGINEHSAKILFVFRFLSGNFQIFGGWCKRFAAIFPLSFVLFFFLINDYNFLKGENCRKSMERFNLFI